MAKAPELRAEAPQIEHVDVLAAKISHLGLAGGEIGGDQFGR
ncbi:MAG TPA: hypothetical protein VK626_11050 [Nitrospiraceae bacterium]|jgi:hypothetical protein|nr:hypothetical protein [Nitrospiraceae bacterium]